MYEQTRQIVSSYPLQLKEQRLNMGNFMRLRNSANSNFFLLLFLLESSYFRGRKLLIHNHESAELLGIGWGRISFGAVID
jgi:hypothetical protein